jgi:hypothetical protein
MTPLITKRRHSIQLNSIQFLLVLNSLFPFLWRISKCPLKYGGFWGERAW